MSGLKCIWNADYPDECDGEVKDRPFFDTHIKVPVCEFHLKPHNNIMFLHKKGYDIEELVNKTYDELEAEVVRLKNNE